MSLAIDVMREQQEKLRSLLSSHLPNTEVWAYGSRIRWTSRLESDLDMVVFTTPAQAGDVARLREAFEESDLPFRVDLSVWDDVPESFRKQIQREHIVLIEANAIQSTWRVPQAGENLDVENEWRVSTWGKEITLEYGKALRGHDTSAGPFRVFGSNGPIGWTDKVLVTGPGVILGRKGAYRGVEYSPKPFFVIDTAYYVVPKIEHSMRWLYYAIKYYKLGEINDGSPIPSTTRAAVYPRELTIPPPSEQRAIAHILGTLDDKIELNRRMNETLEAMARAIFKNWFVDFGPVRAKSQGAPPYLARGLWDLFPDAFDEQGEPAGWRRGILTDIADSPRRAASPSEFAEDTPYIGLEHMPRRSIALAQWDRAGKVTSNKSAFKKGEFLFGKLRPYFHKVGFAPLDGICSTDIVVVIPRAPEWGVFTLACLFSDRFVDYTDQASTGTKMPRTSWKTMGQYSICIPSTRVVHAFQTLLQPAMDRISANIHETRTLATLRDTLLPKLVSGELRIKDAETFLDRLL